VSEPATSIGRIRDLGTLRMANDLRRRYSRVGLLARGVSLILRRLQSLNVQHVHLDRSYAFAPRLSVFPAVTLQMAAHGMLRLAQVPRRSVAVERVENVIRRIDEKFARLPSLATEPRVRPLFDVGDDQPLRPSALPRAVRPVERILPRPANEIAAVARAAAVPRPVPGEAPSAPIALAPARAAAAVSPAPDINRLAGEVLRVIDKRMVAHRERLGRR
jgi:hypothetical protein